MKKGIERRKKEEMAAEYDSPGRFVRVTSLQTNEKGEWRFGLSEIEVYGILAGSITNGLLDV